jgi:hypothetical protein
MTAKELIKGQAFKLPGQRKYRYIIAIMILEGAFVPKEHKGKILIVDDDCHQWILDPEREVIPAVKPGAVLECRNKDREPVIKTDYQEVDIPDRCRTKSDMDEGQITLPDALKLIDSDDCHRFDIHYRYLEGNVKGNIYYGDCSDEDPNLTVERWIKEADSYGSFWLSVWYDKINKKTGLFQIVDDTTFEPL